MLALTERAWAKINLTLHVTGRRSDGYHLLDSTVVFADVGDVLEARPADTLRLTIDGPFSAGLASEPDNLVLRAARMLAAETGHPAKAALRLEKESARSIGDRRRIGGRGCHAATAGAHVGRCASHTIGRHESRGRRSGLPRRPGRAHAGYRRGSGAPAPASTGRASYWSIRGCRWPPLRCSEPAAVRSRWLNRCRRAGPTPRRLPLGYVSEPMIWRRPPGRSGRRSA